MTDLYLNVSQLSKRFGVHRATPWRWLNSDPAFPKPVKLSPGCTRWRLADIEAWESCKAKSTRG